MLSGGKHVFEACKLVTPVDSYLCKVPVISSGQTYLSEATVQALALDTGKGRRGGRG